MERGGGREGRSNTEIIHVCRCVGLLMIVRMRVHVEEQAHTKLVLGLG